MLFVYSVYFGIPFSSAFNLFAYLPIKKNLITMLSSPSMLISIHSSFASINCNGIFCYVSIIR